MSRHRYNLVRFDTWLGSSLGIDPKYAFKAWVLLLFAVPSLGINIFFDAFRNHGNPVDWIPFAVIVYAFTVPTFLLFRLIIRLINPALGLLAVMAAYLGVGLARGAFSTELAILMHLSTPTDMLFRVTGGPVFTLVCLMVFAAVTSQVTAQHEAFRKLTTDRNELVTAIENYQDVHQGLYANLLMRVTQIVDPAIEECRRRLQGAGLESNLGSALGSLQTTVDDIVRPLSHQIASEEVLVTLVPDKAEKVLYQGLLPNRMRFNLVPVWASVLAFAGELASQLLIHHIFEAFLVAGMNAATFFLVLKLIEALVGHRRLRPLPAFLIFLPSYLVAAIAAPLFWIRLPWHLELHERNGFFVLIATLGLVLFAMEMANCFRVEALAELEQVNQEMKLLTSRLRQQVWLDRRRISLVLHGSIQGALHAAAIKLNRVHVVTPELITEVQADITSALAELKAFHVDPINFDEVLESIVGLFEDVVDFEVSLDPRASAILNTNPDAAESAIEVLREAVNNAVKHGSATWIKIEILPIDAGVISVRVENGGTNPEDLGTKGFGSTVLDELTHSWSLINTGSGAALAAEIAVAA